MLRSNRAFSVLELMVVLAVVGLALTAGFASIGTIYEEARKREQAGAAVAMLKKARADALASSSAAAIETIADADGVGVKVTVGIVSPILGKKPCEDWQARASTLETVSFDLLDFKVDRGGADPNLLCFEASAFRLLDIDGLTQAPAPVDIDLFPNTVVEKVTVQPTGSISSTIDSAGFTEGMAMTVLTMDIPPADDPSRNSLSPDELEPDFPVVEAAPPPTPTEPTSDPGIEAMPPPQKVPPTVPPPCAVDSDCGAGYVCNAGNCETPTQNCLSDADCPADQYCDTGPYLCLYGGCNTVNCPFTGCSTLCQHLDCCFQYGCTCA